MATTEPALPPRRTSAAPRWAWGSLIAATVLVAVTTGVFAARHAEVSRPSVGGELAGSASTAAGKRTVVRLPDSSVVTLGPASTIRYVLGPARREIALDGMAEFSVTHDSLRRFTVRAGDAVVTDVGTEFVVRGYRSDSSVRVAVASGIVSLANAASPERAIVLRARDVGGIASAEGGRPTIVSTGDVSLYTAWVDGRLTFDDESLERVAAELGRWFGVNVRVDSRALARRRVSGSYAGPNLDHVLDALAASLGATYTRSNGEIVFRERNR
jgi:transmembrane sensor